MSDEANLLGKYEHGISKRPWLAIGVIVGITLVMGYFASNVSMNTSEGSFQPDSPVARAQERVNENYGTLSTQVSIIFSKESNVLTEDVLLKQLELEEEILSSEYSDYLTETQRNPTGISAPAKTIAQGGYLNTAFSEIKKNNPQLDSELIIKSLLPSVFRLTTEDMKKIINGGTLQAEFPNLGVETELEFQPFEPDFISEYLKNSPFENVLTFLLSNDYNQENQTVEKSLVSITLIENLNQEKLLEIEREFQGLAENVESDGDLDTSLVGNAIVNEEINEASGRNIGLLMPIAFVVVIIILFVVYRSFSDTFLNIIALVMAIVWVYGIGYLLNFTFSPNITAVPLLLIGLGIDYGIHYTLRYREEIEDHHKVSKAVKNTGATVGLAILLTTVTTMVGFSSGIVSDITAVRQFGVLAALGIASSFVIMLTFFPASKILLDRRRQGKGKDLTDGRGYGFKIFGSTEDEFEDWEGPPEEGCSNCEVTSLKAGAVAAKKPLAIMVVVGLVTVAGAYGAYQLEASYDFRDFLPKGLEVTESFNTLIEDFNFSEERVYFLAEGDVTSPSVFSGIGDVQQGALDSPFALGSDPPESPLQLAISLSNTGSPQFNPQFAEIWENTVDSNSDGKIDSDVTVADVEAVYDALYEYAPDEARRVLKRTDEGYSGLVIRIPVNPEKGDSDELVEYMENASEPLRGEGLESVIVTGGPIVSQQTFQSINQGQVNSVLITFIISIAILSALYFYLRKSKFLGIVAISPLVLVITWTLGSMYFLGIPLNPVTVTIAAIIVGLGVDYSIHLTQRYLEDIKKIEKPQCALCSSVGHTGSALFGSAITTVSGFAILSFAIIPPLAQFGQVSALGIFFAFLASVFVLPTFLLAWYKRAKSD